MARLSAFGDLLQSVLDRGRGLLEWRWPDAGRSPSLWNLGRKAGEGSNALALAEELLTERGEVSSILLAEAILTQYLNADPDERLSILTGLASQFGHDPDVINAAIETYRADPNAETAQTLHLASEPRSQELLRRLNHAPDATRRLVGMRADLLAHLRQHPELRTLDHDLHHLLASWFNRGFLVLQQIDWTTPANILEKIIDYEAVHEIGGWDELRRRIDPADRRCFAFFHPAMADDPLIFVEVALTRDIPDAIAPLLADGHDVLPAEAATTAVFYSISNCQEGLRGISFGNFLIKQVVEELRSSVPNLETFVTLSPVPGFAKWLEAQRADEDATTISSEERAALIALDGADWHANGNASTLRNLLPSLAARYLVNAKAGDRPADAVARFHLGNGARLERVNWMADSSSRGLQQSHGVMVNYLYEPKEIERNHEAFAREGRIAMSSAVRKLARTE